MISRVYQLDIKESVLFMVGFLEHFGDFVENIGNDRIIVIVP